MSDQENNNMETAEPEAATESSAPVVPAPVPRKSGGGIGWLALLLVLVLAGGSAWVLQQAQLRETDLKARIAELETVAAQKQDNLDGLSTGLRRDFSGGLDELRAELAGDTSRLTGEVSSVRASLAAQQEELSRFSASDRDAWLMAEAQYLLRLANQRLIMAGDVAAAEALLGSADDVLRQLEDPRLHSSRAAVAQDLAAVRAVPRVDVEGIYLRLAALTNQADQLVIFQMPEKEAQPEAVPAQDWQGRLQQGYRAALAKLSDYIIIRRRDVPMQTLMDPQWEGLVRQNLRMLLEQAQVALLSGNQDLYKQSLKSAGHWVAQFDETDETRAAAMGREIGQLSDQTIAVALPDISGSLRALNEAADQRLEQGGAE